MDETLYKIEFGPPQTYYVDVENAQQDIYPFLLSDLPEKLAEEAERDRLDRRPWGIQTLIERGVNRVAWRQYATELLGSGLVSQRVADTYIPLTNGRISIDKSIEISSPGGNYLPYCWLSYAGAEEDPYFESVDVSRTPELAGCEDWRAISRRLREVARAGTSVPVWLPSRILEQPQLVNIGGFQARCVANELFVESWRNTEVSQTLREHPWEYDLHFEPIKMGGHHLRFFDE